MNANATVSAVAACPHFNPMDPAHLANPYPNYAQLREEAPVFYDAQYDLWFITRYDDIAAAVKQPEIFSSVGALNATGGYSAAVQAVLAQGVGAAQLIVEVDEPVHGRIRRVLNKAFTPQRIAQLEPQIRTLTDQLIDAFVADGRADLVTQFALLLPGLVICDLFGVPRADFPNLKRWTDDWIVLLSVDVSEDYQIHCAHSMVAYQNYLREQFEDRQRQPREDLLTVMLPAEMGGAAPLSVAEAAYNAMNLMAAGHETTAKAIANGLVQLFAHRDQLDQLRANPALIPNAVEEMLRFDTPTQGLFRTTTCPVELSGVTIPAGARVFLVYGSANHDAAQFSESERFDIARPNAREHLAFSRGIHVCIGAPLARLEIRTALERLLERLPNLRPAAHAAPERFEHFWLRGFNTLPTEWDA
jgi:cytochrome P450